jgi:hypothetical protein
MARDTKPRSVGQTAVTRKRIYRPVTRKQQTFYIADALYDQIRSAVVHLAGPPESLTVTAFLERAEEAELSRLRRKHRDGKPFPPLPKSARLRRGARPGEQSRVG